MKTNKKIFAALLAVLITLMFSSIPAGAETGEFVIDTIYVSETGYCEVIGHYEGAALNTQIGCVVANDKVFDGETVIAENFNAENIAWLGQEGTGNNGTFLFQFCVPTRFSESELIVRLTSENADIATASIEVPLLPYDIHNIENNCVIYGKDIYYVPGMFYTPDNIAESVIYGGNAIYFKIGDNWYNLLDEKAVDNSFLTEENATPITEIEKLGIRYYYAMTERV